MDTTGVIGSETGEATEKTSTESSGQGEVAAQGSQGQQDTAGQSQDQAEGGRDQGTEQRRPFRSKNQTIYELRQAVRERDAKLSDFEQRLSRFEQQIQQRTQDRKPSRTFWEAPEEVLEEKIKGHLSEFEKRMLENLQQTRQQDQQSTEWKQETSEAAKFITSQKGLTEDDIADIEELVRSTPEMQAMSPMQRARYALFLWKDQKGITDRSAQKARAATVVGAPSGASGPRPMKEIEADFNKLPRDVSKWTPEDHKRADALEREILQAQTKQ